MTSIDAKEAASALSDIDDISHLVRQSRIYDLASQIMIMWGVLIVGGTHVDRDARRERLARRAHVVVHRAVRLGDDSAAGDMMRDLRLATQTLQSWFARRPSPSTTTPRAPLRPPRARVRAFPSSTL